ncbi:hypothetical protein KCU70_g96, partial [Aureobasidium melanogenum]
MLCDRSRPQSESKQHRLQNHTGGLLRKTQGHHRNASESSTVNSTAPSSPFMQSSTYPYIANADQSPTTSYFSDNDQTFNNVGYAPSKLSHTPAAHLAMQNMAIDQHNSTYNEDIPDFAHSSRHSVSSKGQDSPSTPQPRSSSDHDNDERPPLFKMPTNARNQTTKPMPLASSSIAQNLLLLPTSSSIQTTLIPFSHQRYIPITTKCSRHTAT